MKKSLKMSRVKPESSFHALFFLLIKVISRILSIVRKIKEIIILGERSIIMINIRGRGWIKCLIP